MRTLYILTRTDRDPAAAKFLHDPKLNISSTGCSSAEKIAKKLVAKHYSENAVAGLREPVAADFETLQTATKALSARRLSAFSLTHVLDIR